jgi:hypothetical protein
MVSQRYAIYNSSLAVTTEGPNSGTNWGVQHGDGWRHSCKNSLLGLVTVGPGIVRIVELIRIIHIVIRITQLIDSYVVFFFPSMVR